MLPSTISPRIIKPVNNLPTPRLLRPLTPSALKQKQARQLASALAHEVRNPLSNINLAAGMLKTMITDDDQKMYLDIIMRGSVRINDLVKDFLNSNDPHQRLLENHSVHQLLDEVIAMAEDRIMLKNILVIKDYTNNNSVILVNRPKIKIALTNIIINAIDAMGKGGKLKLVTKSIEDRFIIQIEDNGCGISKENLKNIFKPYFTNKPGGLGLGLTTTYNILQTNHIGVNVQSEEGLGTQFFLGFKKLSI